MPFNPAGVFIRLYNWVADAQANININAERMDQETDGIVAGLNSFIAGEVPFRGPVRTVNGSLSVPSYSFANDPDTGFYRISSDTMGFVAGGVEAFRITPTGVQFTIGADADTLDGQEGAFYRDASNINTGTLDDARLPATISSNTSGNAATASNATNATNAANATNLNAQPASFYLNAGNLTGTLNASRLPTIIASNTSGNAATATTADTALNANSLGGQSLATLRNASNLNTGTISDARLPTTITSNITGNAATATTASNSNALGGV